LQQPEREKLAVADAAATLIEPGMAIGLGSGTTVDSLIDVLGQSPPDASFVAASPATASAAAARSLHVVALDDVKELDLAIDGADQVDPRGWLIKGGGAAHTREKILARAAHSFVVIVSSDKLVTEYDLPCRSRSSVSPPRRHSPTSTSLGGVQTRLGVPTAV
jgi:ribose 5-phosphate isomerase A